MVSFKKEKGNCKPDGINVPEYIQNDTNLAFPCESHFGTEGSFYPADARQAPVTLDDLYTGDGWVATIAEKIIEKEDFSGVFLTFAAVDKYAHLLGDHEKVESKSFKSTYSLEQIAKHADLQVGEVMEAIRKRGLQDKVGIVLTSDHGGQFDRTYLGNGNLLVGGA